MINAYCRGVNLSPVSGVKIREICANYEGMSMELEGLLAVGAPPLPPSSGVGGWSPL